MGRMVFVFLENRLVHIPLSVVTFLLGLYLTIVCMNPPFNPECHAIISNGMLCFFIPYVILILIGSPLISLWYYCNRDSIKREYAEYYTSLEN